MSLSARIRVDTEIHPYNPPKADYTKQGQTCPELVEGLGPTQRSAPTLRGSRCPSGRLSTIEFVKINKCRLVELFTANQAHLTSQ